MSDGSLGLEDEEEFLDQLLPDDKSDSDNAEAGNAAVGDGSGSIDETEPLQPASCHIALTLLISGSTLLVALIVPGTGYIRSVWSNGEGGGMHQKCIKNHLFHILRSVCNDEDGRVGGWNTRTASASLY